MLQLHTTHNTICWQKQVAHYQLSTIQITTQIWSTTTQALLQVAELLTANPQTQQYITQLSTIVQFLL